MVVLAASTCHFSAIVDCIVLGRQRVSGDAVSLQ
jgi:hypothetical protein